jgi:hypothetical protein
MLVLLLYIWLTYLFVVVVVVVVVTFVVRWGQGIVPAEVCGWPPVVSSYIMDGGPSRISLPASSHHNLTNFSLLALRPGLRLLRSDEGDTGAATVVVTCCP